MENQIYLNPTRQPSIFNVELRLPFQTRYIGKIEDETYIKKVNPDTHRFNKNNSIGFNYELIDSGKFRFIKIEYGNKELWTTRLYVLNFGKIQTFFKHSYEKQIFLPIDEFSISKALDYEKTINSQLSLFNAS